MTRLASLFALSLSTMSTGCFLFGNDAADFLEGDDVRIELPESIAARNGGEQIRGDLHVAVEWYSRQTNAWVTTLVENSAKVVGYLDDIQPTSTEGAIRIYGPYDDDQGRDLSWLVRLETLTDGSKYELYVGVRGAKAQADMDLLMTGDLHHEGKARSGGFTMDLDVVEKHAEMKGADGDLTVVAGTVDVTFTRDVETEEKRIDLDFKEVTVEYLGYLDDDIFYSNDRYAYARKADGAGTFVVAAYGEWDDNGWSGPEREKMVVQAAWNADGAGRTHGEILEVDGVGDMKYGDLYLDECSGTDGFLTWRALNDVYAVAAPGYNFGDEATCLVPLSAFEGL